VKHLFTVTVYQQNSFSWQHTCRP